ncbi:hypothetical protein VCRA2119O147_10016 [Vibrio crassostreae]|uniref:Uncharacterized protein n=1 Tax=Vibrio crassostreae TaxID=246167 RepID=A0A822N111_9VIBR|nr:hypothetical protein VCRA2116O26_100039 [Vibrio crassostreae]CDT91709.1 hypothetical protein VCR14J2_210139 [Vibrio coralliirubri]CAK1695541.1 hypothetical protein VCRA2119O46_100038 [Vibrio crassostreae]CAK1704994.1 hypothetical protein VCRA2117O38_100126 [Vibrio crassostreae]CAK1714200.1 hypothetical protein VCRA2117O39_110038 [Vibrio crassostreae]
MDAIDSLKNMPCTKNVKIEGWNGFKSNDLICLINFEAA